MLIMTILTRPTDIATYRAAIAAKKDTDYFSKSKKKLG